MLINVDGPEQRPVEHEAGKGPKKRSPEIKDSDLDGMIWDDDIPQKEL